MGIVSIVAATVIVKPAVLPLILVFVGLNEVKLHAVNGLGDLVRVSLAHRLSSIVDSLQNARCVRSTQ